MKTKLISSILCCTFVFTALPLLGQNKTDTVSGSILEGIWQNQSPSRNENGKFLLRPSGFFKTLTKDGKVYNMTIIGYKAVFSHTGRYYITSDSTYVEQIKGSYSNQYKGHDTPMRYKYLPKEKILFMQYWEPKNQKWNPEIWKKVEDIKPEDIPAPTKQEELAK